MDGATLHIIGTLGALVISFLALMLKAKASSSSDVKELVQAATKIAVLEERMNNISHKLDHLADLMESIQKELK